MHLADINIWLALTFEVHAHHRTAKAWFEGTGPDSCAFCRLTQQGFLRLATNPAVFKDEARTNGFTSCENLKEWSWPGENTPKAEDTPTGCGTMHI